MNPFIKFQSWYQEALTHTTVKIPSACCLSTLGLDGYPNARFVALKEVKDEAFLITGPLSSRKGAEIKAHPQVALTFWWTSTERQVRVQGNAESMEATLADGFFNERNREARLVAWASQQGALLQEADQLHQSYNALEERFKDKEIPRPDDWGGFVIKPIRIEFLEFKNSRFHDRVLYVKNGAAWTAVALQP